MDLSGSRLSAAIAFGFQNYALAAELYVEALEEEPADLALATNLGACLTHTRKFDKAIRVLSQAMKFDSTNPDILTQLALAYWAAGDFENAEIFFNRAIPFDRSDTAKSSLGHVLMAQGKYNRGWDCLSHWLVKEGLHRGGPLPTWQGDRISDPLLVWATQGMGDEILYASMIPDLLKLTPNVVWEVSERLLPIFQRSFPTVDFRPRLRHSEADWADSAQQIPACVLGGWLRRDIRQFSVAAYLKASPRRLSEKYTIGVSYHSTNAKFGSDKSIPINQWEGILQTGHEFIDLQYGRKATHPHPHPRLRQADVDCDKDLDGVASVLLGCDLVITVSNTLAHLSCALGVPTLVLVDSSLGRLWYWGHKDPTTPWYGSASIVRKCGEDWAPTMAQIAEGLKAVTHA